MQDTVRISLSDSFVTGNDLPLARLENAAAVHYRDTIALIGGSTSPFSPGNLDTILVYNPDADSWTTMSQRLSKALTSVTAFPVKKSIFPACFQ